MGLIGVAPFLAAFFPLPAAAATLRYAAPNECPPLATLQEEVEHLLDSSLASAPAVDVLVQITRVADNDWQVVISIVDTAHVEPRTRSVSAHSCVEAANTAAVAAAIAIRARDPESAGTDSAS